MVAVSDKTGDEVWKLHLQVQQKNNEDANKGKKQKQTELEIAKQKKEGQLWFNYLEQEEKNLNYSKKKLQILLEEEYV